jgi:predicted PurR-regulated permease PerM
MRWAIEIIGASLGYAIITWPLVRRMERRLPRAFAIVIVDAGIALALAAISFALAPVIYAQAQASVAALPGAGTALLAALPDSLQRWLAGALEQLDLSIAAYARDAVQAGIAILRSAASLAAAAIVIPVLAAYFQLDGNRYANAIFAIVPERYHGTARRALDESSGAVAGFVRGQVIVSSIVGLLLYAVLSITGVPFAAAIALLAGVLDLVPYLGGIAAFVPSLLFALAFHGAGRAAIVALLIIAVFEFEAQVLSPQILGSRTGLPPSVVVLALIAGSAIFGVFGLYLAVPTAAGAAAIVRVILQDRTGSSPLFPPPGVSSEHAYDRR